MEIIIEVTRKRELALLYTGRIENASSDREPKHVVTV